MWFTNHINTSKITGCSPNLIYLLQGLWFVFQWFTSACCDKSLILNQWKTVPLNVRSAMTWPADRVFPKSKAFLSLRSFSSIFSLCSWGHHSIKRWRADIKNCKALRVFKVRYRLSKTTIKHFRRSESKLWNFCQYYVTLIFLNHSTSHSGHKVDQKTI